MNGRDVCGRDWATPAELDAILRSATDAGQAWVPVTRGAPAPEAQAKSVEHVEPELDAPLLTEESFRAKFEMVPSVLSEWVAPYFTLEGRDILDFGCGEGTAALSLALNYAPRRVVGESDATG